jgi:hypothetical protein
MRPSILPSCRFLAVFLLAAASARAEIVTDSRTRFIPNVVGFNHELTLSHHSAIDPEGNVYHLGHHEAAGGGMSSIIDVVVWRINADGTDGGLWTFGGSGGDVGRDIAIDDAGFLYITGETWSTDLPIRNAAQPAKSEGASDAFILKLEWNVGIVWATYLGGAGSTDSGSDSGHAIDVHANGSVVLVGGQTASASFPVTGGASQPLLSGPSDGFLARLSGDGALLDATYLGGSGDDAVHAVVARAAHEVAVGETAGGIPQARNAYGGGSRDAFVAAWFPGGQLGPVGASPGTRYYGGNGRDVAYGVTHGSLNQLSYVRFVVGQTDSADLPQAPGRGNGLGTTHQRTLGGESDAFLAVWEGGQSTLLFSSYFGGPGTDWATDVLYHDEVTLVGRGGVDFPTKPQMPAGTGTGLGDAFVTRFEKDHPMDDDTGLVLRYSTLLGEMRRDVATGVVGDFARVYVGGWSADNDLDNGRMTSVKILRSDRVEQPAAAFEGSWTTSTSSAHSGGTAAESSTAGARAVFRFRGTAFAWIGTDGPANGVALVSVDGATPQRVDVSRGHVFHRADLANTDHTVTIEVTGEPGSSSTGTAVVVDAFEIVGSAIAPPPPTPTPTAPPGAWTRIEQGNAHVTLDGNWYSHGSGVHSGGSAALAMDAGVHASLSFTGSGVRWIGVKDPWSGIAKVYVDGALRAEVDTYSATEHTRTMIFEQTWASSGAHTIRVEATGTRHASSGGAWVWVDAFDVLGGAAPTPTSTPTATPTPTPTPTPTGTPTRTRIEETQVPTIGWHTHSHAVHSGGSAITAMDAGKTVRFTFTGTGVRWIGLKDPWSGIAGVYLDGPAVAEIDTYSATEQAQVVLYAISGLAPGTHTLDIVGRGTRNPASGNSSIWVDAFDVESGGATPAPTATPTPGPTGTPPTTTTRRVEDGEIATLGWHTHTHPVHSGGSAKIDTDVGGGVEYTFTGTGIRWIGLKDPWSGIARVWVDGTAVADIDTYSAVEQARATLYEKMDLAPGTHRITIVVLPERNPASGNHAIWLDAFDVIGGP